mgnify:CR=1 FL=1
MEEPSFEALENTLPIGVFKMDTLEAARMLYQKKGEGEKVAFLNMASEFKAGGGVANGSLAQEESIARRSNLVQSLNKAFYPLASDELLFSPEVTVIRDEQLRFDPDHEFPCAAISCAAIRKPDLRADGHYRQKHATLMENKILAILKVAIMNDIDNLVLGAFGCGAFCNPVNDVAAIFKKILVMDGYARFFKRIVFAILTKSEKDWNNLKVFSTMFAGFVVPNNK